MGDNINIPEPQQETLPADNYIEKTIDDCIKEDSIVWFKESSGGINTGKVVSIENERKVFVFNYDGWTCWIIDFDSIVRCDVTFYTDTYRQYRQYKIPE